MNEEIKGYLKAEAIVSAVFNFFINGMAAALIYHKADIVPTGAISVAVDLTATCLLMFILTALFCRASVRRTKTAGILKTGSRIVNFLSKLFVRPVLFGALTGIIAAVALFTLTAPLFAVLGISTLPFGVYVALKCVFTSLLGGGVTALELYLGMVAAG